MKQQQRRVRTIIQDEIDPGIFERLDMVPDGMLIVFENKFRPGFLSVLFNGLKIPYIFLSEMGKQ